MSTSHPRETAGPGERSHVETLLARYPDVTVAEAAEILRFIKKGPPIEVGLISADDRLRPQVERFRKDHPGAFALGLRDWLIVALLVIGVVNLCALFWGAGAG